jgi:carbamoyl-phosphate synthase small subunit
MTPRRAGPRPRWCWPTARSSGARASGATGHAVGEVCFNTSMTGYQEIITDPVLCRADHHLHLSAYRQCRHQSRRHRDDHPGRARCRHAGRHHRAGQLALGQAARRLAEESQSARVSATSTRALITRRIRDGGAPNGVVVHAPDGKFDIPTMRQIAIDWPGLDGMDLAIEVTTKQTYNWDETRWALGKGYGKLSSPKYHVVAVDYGAKRNILRCLANTGCKVTVVPATATAEDILRHKPDGVFLSNGPGDPAATAVYASPAIQAVLDRKVPLFGICLGHQILALTLGGKTRKMERGHRGRQPAGQGPDDRQGRDHVAEPRLLRHPRIAAREHRGDARLAVRRHQRRPAMHRQAGLLRPVPPRGLARPDRQPLSLRPLRRDDRMPKRTDIEPSSSSAPARSSSARPASSTIPARRPARR